jgi:VCBS repeat protein/type IX secretion system substrate protein
MKRIITSIAVAFSLNTNAQVCFNVDTNYAAGANPNIVISSDFNNDGFKDIAAANNNDSTIAILLGNGTGVFGAPTSFTVGQQPVAITVADFNNDSKQDLALLFFNAPHAISIWLGTGTGSFNAASSFTVDASSNQLNSIISSDFNGDGKADLAITKTSSSGIAIVLGTGTGSFGAQTSYTVSGHPNALIGADFNGDGKIDLASTNVFPNNLSILLGNGTGTFGSSTTFTLPLQPISFTNADFNEDGKIDLAISSTVYDSVCILLGTGTGSFGTPKNNAYGFGGSILTEDFNGDGHKDLAMSNASNGISVLEGNGLGNFGSVTTFTTGTQTYGSIIFSADFNGDTKPDLTVGNSVHVAVLLNCSSTAGINELSDNKELINIYPNPANGYFNVNAKDATVTVTDCLGRTISSTRVNGTQTINVPEQGVYVAQIVQAGKVFTQRLINK